jgi:hypothetical protein
MSAQQAPESLEHATSAEAVAATVKQRLVDILEPYQPQAQMLEKSSK